MSRLKTPAGGAETVTMLAQLEKNAEAILASLNEVVTAAKETLANLRTHEKELRETHNDLVNQSAELKAQVATEAANLRNLRRLQQALLEQNEALAEKESRHRVEIDRQTHELAGLKERCAALAAEQATYTSANAELRAESERLQAELADLRAEREELLATGRPLSPWVQPDLPFGMVEGARVSSRLPKPDRYALQILVDKDFWHRIPAGLGRSKDEVILKALRSHIPSDVYDLALEMAREEEAERQRIVPGSLKRPPAGEAEKAEPGQSGEDVSLPTPDPQQKRSVI